MSFYVCIFMLYMFVFLLAMSAGKIYSVFANVTDLVFVCLYMYLGCVCFLNESYCYGMFVISIRVCFVV